MTYDKKKYLRYVAGERVLCETIASLPLRYRCLSGTGYEIEEIRVNDRKHIDANGEFLFDHLVKVKYDGYPRWMLADLKMRMRPRVSIMYLANSCGAVARGVNPDNWAHVGIDSTKEGGTARKELSNYRYSLERGLEAYYDIHDAPLPIWPDDIPEDMRCYRDMLIFYAVQNRQVKYKRPNGSIAIYNPGDKVHPNDFKSAVRTEDDEINRFFVTTVKLIDGYLEGPHVAEQQVQDRTTINFLPLDAVLPNGKPLFCTLTAPKEACKIFFEKVDAIVESGDVNGRT